ncbi:M13 family metallopeptidase [Rubripirellula reticaptiva]|uniref:Neutral endopeptidase n=1 Tax=Rubripirellula reticaptiva TaxID=2528013 RepID=A0A5C6F1T9_9BACT|nr:M13 family metallopeptidase [Rubripirellula reticaptiva]TWU55055.1 Neutral endopeptidase [Rubripirellula reticaptiva]
MKPRFLLIVFVFTSVFAAQNSAVTAQDAAISTANVTASKVSGIDKSLFSDTISPGENFYRYANQLWLENTEIPGDKSNYGIFTILDDETREQVRTLIEKAAEVKSKAGSPAQKVGDLYRSVLDVDARNQAGVGPLNPMLKLIDGASTKNALAEAMGELNRMGIYGPLAPYVDVDARDSDAYTVYVTQTGLTLPDRDYYLEDDERYVELRAKLKAYITDMLVFVGQSGDAATTNAIFEFEKAIATNHWTKVENRDPIKTYNKTTNAEMQKMLGEFDWAAYTAAIGLAGQDAFVVRQPSYLEAFGKLFAETSLDDLKAYLRLRVIDSYGDNLSEVIEKRHFDFNDTAVSGVTEQEPLWKRGVNITGSVLGELVGQLYVEEHFRPEAKQRMNELVDNLKLAFEKRIESRDWMGEGTKKQAREKLSMFATKIGYPDKWKDYSKLQVASPILANNLIAAAEFENQRELKKLGEPIDRNEWHMTPQTINAYYNPTMNEIVFPAAILQPPFFNLLADDAVNYGGIGAVIGHELSHGFDDKGSEYDGKGNLRKWWTESDREEFERRAEGLVEQYNDFEPIAGNFVNGELTLGENIGDLGGLSVAYEAYQLSLGGKEAPVIDGLTGDQRFFLGWSQVWRRLYLEPELLKRLITDPHSPSEYRVNGIVRNIDAWYDAFGVKPDDALFLKPEDRVRIW